MKATGNIEIDRGWRQVVKQGPFVGVAGLSIFTVPWTCGWNLMMESNGCVLDLHLSRGDNGTKSTPWTHGLQPSAWINQFPDDACWLETRAIKLDIAARGGRRTQGWQQIKEAIGSGVGHRGGGNKVVR
ncbi:hypothetical protein NL676_038513 [Syzygium grande]|nr:hypothetical protein NL676_038513 [Syzygium grande]